MKRETGWETYVCQVIRETGMNPSVMKGYFPGRTQRHLKNKMNRELAKHPELVYAALDDPRPMGELWTDRGGDSLMCLDRRRLPEKVCGI